MPRDYYWEVMSTETGEPMEIGLSSTLEAANLSAVSRAAHHALSSDVRWRVEYKGTWVSVGQHKRQNRPGASQAAAPGRDG